MENNDQMNAERYKALFMSSRDAVMTLEPPSWKFTSANPATVAMFKAKDEQDFLRYPPWELSPKMQPDGSESMGEAMEMIQEAMLKGSNFFEWTHKRVDGEDFPTEVLLSKIEQGGKSYLHAVIRDISERKKLEKMSVESAEEKFRIIFDNTNDGMILVDAETNIFTLGNRAISEMLGYTSDELKKIGVTDIHPKDDLPGVLEQYNKQARGELKVASNIPVKRKDGSIFYADINTSNIVIGGKKYNLGVFRDITEHKRIEDELRLSQATYLGIINSVDSAVYVQDENGIFLDVNETAEKMYGYPKSEFIGKTPEFLSAPGKNDLAKIAKFVSRAYAGEVLQFEFWGLRKDGSIFPKDVSLTPGTYFGKKVVIAVSRDITERKKSEEALKSKIEELEKLNKFMVGRELKMTELKLEIEELKAKLAEKLANK